jgi:hypothetical protein
LRIKAKNYKKRHKKERKKSKNLANAKKTNEIRRKKVMKKEKLTSST